MGVYDADTLPVDDDTFLNGGTPPSAPAAESLPTEESNDEFEASAIDPTPAEKSTSSENKQEPYAPIETKDVSIQPSAKFTAEMQERAKREDNTKENVLETLDDSTFSRHDDTPHAPVVMTPSQAMIPDGMLAENRVKLDEDEEEKPAETMVPSQAMAETFTAVPTPPPTTALDGTPLNDEVDDEEEDDEDEGEDDDEPIVVGPVISSAGMESLTEEQAENPNATIQAESMKMEAKIDEEELGEHADKPTETATSEKPAEAATLTEPTPAETTTPTEPEKPAEPEEATEKSKEEAPKEESPKVDYSFVTQPSVMTAAPNPTPTVASTKDVTPHAKNTHPAAFIILGLVLLAVVGLIVAAIILAGSNKNDENNNTEQSEEKKTYSFFLPDSDGYSSLYNSDGEKLSDVKVSGADSTLQFLNRSAIVVYSADGHKAGVMNNKGKMVVDFGEYDEIYQAGSAFYTAKNDVGDIITENKKIEKIKILTAANNNLRNNGAIVALKDKKIVVYNGNGDDIFSMDCAKRADNTCDESVMPSVTLYDNTDYYSDDTTDHKIGIYYNYTVHILNANTGEVEVKFNSKSAVAFVTYLKRNNTYYLFGNEGYIFVSNGKVVNTPKKCTGLNTRKANNELYISCETTDGEYYLYDDMTFGVKMKSNRQILGINTWADLENGEVKFYKDGKLVKTMKGNYWFTSEDISGFNYYIIRTKCASKCPDMNSDSYDSYYDANGNKAIKDDYATAHAFNPKTEAAIVTNDRGKNHLIDKKGKKLTSDYNKIYLVNAGFNNWYYEANDNINNKSILLDKAGNVISDDFGFEVKVFDGDLYYTGANDTTLYKKGGEKIFETEDERTSITLEEYYFLTLKNNKYTAYTYSGKEFHSYTRKIYE